MWPAVRRFDLPDPVDAVARAGLAADHHAVERLGAAAKPRHWSPRHARHGRPVRGVNDRLGHDRLAPGPVGHHDAAGVAAGVAQHVGRVTTVEELDAGLQQRVVQDLLDVHRPGRAELGGLPLGPRRRRPDHLDLAQQNPLRVGSLLDQQLDVTRRGLHRQQQRDAGPAAGAGGGVLDPGRLLPGLFVVAGQGGYRGDLVGAGPAGVMGHDADPLDRLHLAQVEQQVHVAVVLHALLIGIAPGAVAEHARRARVLVNARAGQVGLVGELDPVRVGQVRVRGRVAEDPLGQRVGRRLARLQPQAQRGRHVVAQVGIGGSQKDLGAGPGGRARHTHRAGAPTHHDHVDPVSHGDLPGGFVNGRP